MSRSHCRCGHILDHPSRDGGDCRHCFKAKCFIGTLDASNPANAQALAWARKRLARHNRGRDVMHAPMLLDGLALAARTVGPS